MKTTMIFFMFYGFVTFAQNPYKEPVSYVSRNKDTLFLINDPVGKMIKSLWDEKAIAKRQDLKKAKPVIMMVADLPQVRRKEK